MSKPVNLDNFIRAETDHYLRTKAERAGHLLDVDALIQAAQ